MTERELLDQVYLDYRNWKGWAKPHVSRSTLSALKDIQKLRLPKESHLLEIGFGRGDLLRATSKLGFIVQGVERSGAIVQDLIEDGFEVSCNGTGHIASKSQDIAVALDVFEHLSIIELHVQLQELSRVLKGGGILLARFPNNASPFGSINQTGDVTHRVALSGRSLGQLARISGFETLKISNPSYVWFDGSLAWTVASLPRWLCRRAIELFLSVAYYGHQANLDSDVVVVLKRLQEK
jgi:cyclopropane fatty-acyl-phospholipid synthase-like methyltransferase